MINKSINCNNNDNSKFVELLYGARAGGIVIDSKTMYSMHSKLFRIGRDQEFMELAIIKIAKVLRGVKND